MKRALGATAISAVLLVGGVACSSDSKNETPDTTSATSTTAAGPATSFEIMTSDGQLSLSLDGRLPPGWPSSFPLPDGATAAGSGSLGDSDKTVMAGVFTYSGPAQDAYTFYTREADLNIESQSGVGIDDGYVGTVSFSGSESGRITMLSREGQAYIIVVLNASEGGTTGGTERGGS